LFSLRSSLLSGIRSGLHAERNSDAVAIPATERDIPMRLIVIGLVLFVLPLMILYQAIVSQWSVSIPMTIIMIVTGFLFVSVSAYMAGIVGSSNNPVSGLTIATILFAVCRSGTGLPAGKGFTDWCGSNDHDRRGGLLCGVHRWR
jgi:uncharacterized oligopeptide transporter (OPT) family protein